MPATAPPPSPTPALTPADVARLRARRGRRTRRTAAVLALALLAGFALALSLGQTVVPPAEVLAVLAGREVPGASFLVGELRLPRALVTILAGLCFGMGGAAFQTLLRNPLASPDIVGITSGGSAAAVVAIVFLGWSGAAVSALSLAAGLGVAATIWLLARRGGMAGTRLILVGIGISAMLDSVIAWTLLQAPAWTLTEAMHWLAGSVNAAHLSETAVLLVGLAAFGGLLMMFDRDLQALRLGEDKAAALGVRPGRARLAVTLAATGLVSVATAITGPIAFLAFLSGPIAARIAGPDRSVLIPAALTGALIALCADHVGQFLLPARYPVGIVTGVLGAPWLLYLVIRSNRSGGP